ncbi:MAG: TldD/PmbA family protein [Acidobacteria bacterium]|nr:TldD/PmbA family protein [Acidobacteriota bacterium]
MLSEERAHGIFELIKKRSSADELEVLISGGRSALTRFANNTIHQNVAEENMVVSIRAIFGQKTARANTNKLDEEGLARAVKAAESIARVQQENPSMLPMATPEDAAIGEPHRPPPSRFFETTAAMTPADRAEAVSRVVGVARAEKLTAAGIYATSESCDALLNSRGVSRFHRQTSAEISITMLAGDSSGWQKANSPDARNLDPVRLAETAARKARDSAHPRELPPGKYTVVLEPAAVLDLLGFLFWDWGALAILDQRSFLTNRVGTKIFGENINIFDDVCHPLQSGAPFDGEGIQRQRVQLVDRGTVSSLVYARASAAMMRNSEHAAKVGHIRPTGHGFPLPNEIGEMPLNIVVEPASKSRHSLEQMIASTGRGVLVTRLWYIREVDPYEKILTGMTRDGTFLVEDGCLQAGVRNFRFNQSMVNFLQNVEIMSDPVRASGEESFDMVVPAMKVRDFNFTEVTKF